MYKYGQLVESSVKQVGKYSAIFFVKAKMKYKPENNPATVKILNQEPGDVKVKQVVRHRSETVKLAMFSVQPIIIITKMP